MRNEVGSVRGAKRGRSTPLRTWVGMGCMRCCGENESCVTHLIELSGCPGKESCHGDVGGGGTGLRSALRHPQGLVGRARFRSTDSEVAERSLTTLGGAGTAWT